MALGKCKLCGEIVSVNNHTTIDGSVTLLVRYDCTQFVEDMDLSFYDPFPAAGGK